MSDSWTECKYPMTMVVYSWNEYKYPMHTDISKKIIGFESFKASATPTLTPTEGWRLYRILIITSVIHFNKAVGYLDIVSFKASA